MAPNVYDGSVKNQRQNSVYVFLLQAVVRTQCRTVTVQSRPLFLFLNKQLSISSYGSNIFHDITFFCFTVLDWGLGQIIHFLRKKQHHNNTRILASATYFFTKTSSKKKGELLNMSHHCYTLASHGCRRVIQHWWTEYISNLWACEDGALIASGTFTILHK